MGKKKKNGKGGFSHEPAFQSQASCFVVIDGGVCKVTLVGEETAGQWLVQDGEGNLSEVAATLLATSKEGARQRHTDAVVEKALAVSDPVVASPPPEDLASRIIRVLDLAGEALGKPPSLLVSSEPGGVAPVLPPEKSPVTALAEASDSSDASPPFPPPTELPSSKADAPPVGPPILDRVQSSRPIVYRHIGANPEAAWGWRFPE